MRTLLIPLYRYVGVLVVVTAVMLPLSVSAASIYMETAPGPVSAGDIVTVKAYLDTDSAPANALDGMIDLGGASAFTVQSISDTDSELTLWPTPPALSSDGKSISFTGGLPGGFTGTHLLLFTMTLRAETSGTESFTPTSTTLYLNDGKGTATPVSTVPLSITVEQSSTRNIPLVVLLSLVVLVLIAYGIWGYTKRSHKA